MDALLLGVPAFVNADKKTRANFKRRLKVEAKKNNGNDDEYARSFRDNAEEDYQNQMVESVEPLPSLRVLKMTKAERIAQGSHKISEYMKPVVKSLSSSAAIPETDSDSEGNPGGAGFKKIKKHVTENIALFGKEDQLKMGNMSLSVARSIRELNELKRSHRGVIISRRDLIDAERPINYELSIM
jgi:hypothetical protein